MKNIILFTNIFNPCHTQCYSLFTKLIDGFESHATFFLPKSTFVSMDDMIFIIRGVSFSHVYYFIHAIHFMPLTTYAFVGTFSPFILHFIYLNLIFYLNILLKIFFQKKSITMSLFLIIRFVLKSSIMNLDILDAKTKLVLNLKILERVLKTRIFIMKSISLN